MLASPLDLRRRLKSGLTLPEYSIRETIGQGTFGKVKSAIHKKTGSKRAIKIINKDRIARSTDKKRILKEIKILQRLDHPNIIKLFEVVDSKRNIFLVMDYIPNGELFNFIVDHGRLEEWQGSRLFRQLIDAVDYMHSQNVVHRDLKPENLLLDEKVCLRICDFGLGNVNDKGFMFKTACGSPCYVAPEMIAGGFYHGAPVDIWACGVILYAMICGYLPFEDTGKISELYDLICEANFEVPEFISSDARDLIQNILVVDVEKRYTAQQIRKHRWCQLPGTSSARKDKDSQQSDPSLEEDDIAINALKEMQNFYRISSSNTRCGGGSPQRKPSSSRSLAAPNTTSGAKESQGRGYMKASSARSRLNPSRKHFTWTVSNSPRNRPRAGDTCRAKSDDSRASACPSTDESFDSDIAEAISERRSWGI
mmetsp:Transcript_18431/g.33032  ORF Transcript_18431/g.33032 Transcript_18431/m.33032 type:complete len:424 (+) Transcript_18431:71-1342(+)|eukprot:CAMPEP_0197533568 /NCGR_PEP_ID=MMETSP1318-20131121/43924_1 /TAXON_ID=552666 /ORGANISM="Partenskyella glossopodia, Strain RCC365" /LENGTH=423 /DNA_ID=CAMNT_0043090509 /DNA_START=51 /DNA_END=1322 /DNA_ORIENTATION=-